jgi:hypothetical protein
MARHKLGGDEYASLAPPSSGTGGAHARFRTPRNRHRTALMPPLDAVVAAGDRGTRPSTPCPPRLMVRVWRTAACAHLPPQDRPGLINKYYVPVQLR